MRAEDVDHPDELRIDLDPTPEANWDMVRQVAVVVGNILHEFGYEGYPKTSGSRGIHINIRVEPKWDFRDLRRGAFSGAIHDRVLPLPRLLACAAAGKGKSNKGRRKENRDRCKSASQRH